MSSRDPLLKALTIGAEVLAALACILALFVALAILPITLARASSHWLPPLLHGEYALMAMVAIVAAVPFGLAFGAIPARNVAVKSLAVSVCAAMLLLAFAAAIGGLHARTWKPFALEGVLFVALFTSLAIVGGRLAARFSRRAAATLGTVGLVTAFGLVVVWPFYASIPTVPMTPEARLDRALQQAREARSDIERFHALSDAAKQSFVLGRVDDAREFANELLRLAPQFESDWNYGNAIHDGNMVLGRIAVGEGRMDDAGHFLLKAGATRGSPQLDSFGPNMSLARDLLEKGEREVVLQYFELCRKFWELNNGRLDQWGGEVRAGTVPDFGANLVY